MREWVSFAEIKRRITLEQALRSYQVNWLRRSGVDQYRGRCPIHRGEGEEAFHANLKRGIFHCFACGAGGNVLDFVAAIEGSSLREAALRLREYHKDSSPNSASVTSGLAEENWLRKKELPTRRWTSRWNSITAILTWDGAGSTALLRITSGWAIFEDTD